MQGIKVPFWGVGCEAPSRLGVRRGGVRYGTVWCGSLP